MVSEFTEDEKKEVMAEYKTKYAEVMAQREEIMAAFVAKYGCDPSEMVQVEERPTNSTLLWFLVRKQDCIFCTRCKEAIAQGEPRTIEN